MQVACLPGIQGEPHILKLFSSGMVACCRRALCAFVGDVASSRMQCVQLKNNWD